MSARLTADLVSVYVCDGHAGRRVQSFPIVTHVVSATPADRVAAIVQAEVAARVWCAREGIEVDA